MKASRTAGKTDLLIHCRAPTDVAFAEVNETPNSIPIP